jgi:hypothetical protein
MCTAPEYMEHATKHSRRVIGDEQVMCAQREIREMSVQTAWDLQDVCADSVCERTDTVDARVPDASYRET